MDGKIKFPRNQGRAIGLKKAKAQRRKWQKGASDRKHPADSFNVPFDLLTKSISIPECSAVKFCNGLDENGHYTPIICAIDQNGRILMAFDEKRVIEESDFDACQKNWSEKHPLEDGHPQFFFYGSDSIRQNIEDFDIGRYKAVFVKKDNGDDSALLLGYSATGMKDPNEDDEEPETALNFTGFCPPVCE